MAYNQEELTEFKKWMISIRSALIFLIIASPLMFKLTGYIFSKAGFTTQSGGCPNWYGLIIHAIVFGCIIRLSMLVPLE